MKKKKLKKKNMKTEEVKKEKMKRKREKTKKENGKQKKKNHEIEEENSCASSNGQCSYRRRPFPRGPIKAENCTEITFSLL